MTRLRVVVSAVSHSGTGYLASLLNAAGLSCGHEAVFTPNKVHDVRVSAEVSWLALPYLEEQPDKYHVMHQIRNPLHVVRSLCNGMMAKPGNQYRLFIERNWDRPAPDEDALIGEWVEWFSHHVVDWNHRCEKVALQTWRLEDVDEWTVRAIADAAGSILTRERIPAALERVSTSTNKHLDGPDLDWSDVPNELVDLGRQFGYC